MARVKGQLKYSGSIQDTTFYSLPGSDAVFARMKGGPSKRRMKEASNLLQTPKPIADAANTNPE